MILIIVRKQFIFLHRFRRKDFMYKGRDYNFYVSYLVSTNVHIKDLKQFYSHKSKVTIN